MVSGAYKTEYGEADEIQEVADKIKVTLAVIKYWQHVLPSIHM